MGQMWKVDQTIPRFSSISNGDSLCCNFMLMVIGGPPSKSELFPVFQGKKMYCDRLVSRSKILMPSRPNHSPLSLTEHPGKPRTLSLLRSLNSRWQQPKGQVLRLLEDSKR